MSFSLAVNGGQILIVITINPREIIFVLGDDAAVDLRSLLICFLGKWALLQGLGIDFMNGKPTNLKANCLVLTFICYKKLYPVLRAFFYFLPLVSLEWLPLATKCRVECWLASKKGEGGTPRGKDGHTRGDCGWHGKLTQNNQRPRRYTLRLLNRKTDPRMWLCKK